ncbi:MULTISPECIES: AzlC family ABC transporter permease [Pseudoalteromonas]|uniref:AzlC family ABC transporter permease n=1 Tax=Pseudoalteromonas obscura TaxID=3048491 RepID=A0ABT7EMD0_9GAMM|nr:MULTISPECIES: AzlC family ABC transporter permease [Pseudoalteromonas]MBQ4837877.1 AzlC family ABC transporter permease [Pseudoalteromonas luteoviolacea]MDK2596177.1 AzlC family ABC transporter permease [Pseudoalteromonas sp. P94(2023)]
MNIAIKKGLLDMLPLNLAVLPWGILCGSLAIQNGFSALEAQLMSLLVFAGSAQLVAIELMAKGASMITLVITTFIISARHLLYGLAIRNNMIDKPLKWRGPIAFFLTDELFAFSHHHRAYQGKLRLIYALVAGGSFYLAWNLWTLFGIVAGQFLPDLTNLGLDFAIAAIFIALVVPGVSNLPVFCACLVSGVTMLYFKWIEFEFGLVAAALLGMSTGYVLQAKEDKS